MAAGYSDQVSAQLEVSQDLSVTLQRFRERREQIAKSRSMLQENLRDLDAQFQLLDEACEALGKIVTRTENAVTVEGVGTYR